MKQLNNYKRITGYFSKVYNQINKDFFDNELPEVVITCQASKSSYGHASCAPIWWTNDGKGMHEINISADYLHRDRTEFIGTFLHEVTHIYCAIKNITDCKGYYHTKDFARVATEKAGLIIERIPGYGWTKTSISERVLDWLCENEWITEIQISRQSPDYWTYGGATGNGTNGTADKPDKPKAKKKSSYRRYVCPVCGNIARTTKDMNLICGDCMEKMVLSE